MMNFDYLIWEVGFSLQMLSLFILTDSVGECDGARSMLINSFF